MGRDMFAYSETDFAYRETGFKHVCKYSYKGGTGFVTIDETDHIRKINIVHVSMAGTCLLNEYGEKRNTGREVICVLHMR